MFKFEIVTDGAVFKGAPGEELARILVGVAGVLTDPAMAVALEDGATVTAIKDSTGETVGQWMYIAN